MHSDKTLDIYYSLHEILPQTYTQFCNKHLVNVGWPILQKCITTRITKQCRACTCCGGDFED